MWAAFPRSSVPFSKRLLPPDDVGALADRISDVLWSPPVKRAAEADSLAAFVHDGFSIDGMVDAVLASYRDALAERGRPRGAIPAARPGVGAKVAVPLHQPEVRR